MKGEIGTYHARHRALTQGERPGPETLPLNHPGDRGRRDGQPLSSA